MAHAWKACWVQALKSSNLLSSADSDQATRLSHPTAAYYREPVPVRIQERCPPAGLEQGICAQRSSVVGILTPPGADVGGIGTSGVGRRHRGIPAGIGLSASGNRLIA